MEKRIVIGQKDQTSSPLYLIDQIWRPENWFLVRGSALAQHVDSDERVLVTGLGSNPPVGTIIDAGEIYSLYTYNGRQTQRTSGIWQYKNRYDMGNIKAFFKAGNQIQKEVQEVVDDYRYERLERRAPDILRDGLVCLSGPFLIIKQGKLKL
jgi:hypothetical protein